MTPGRTALIGVLLLLATGLTLLLALATRRRLPAFASGGPPRELRSAWCVEVVGAAIVLLGTPGVARQFAHAPGTGSGASLAPIEPGVWAIVAGPVAAASVALGLATIRGCSPRAPTPLAIGSTVGAGVILLLLSLAGRMVLGDALLVGLIIPAWAWLMGELGPVRHASPTAAAPPRSPGGLLLLIALPLGGILGFLALDPRFSSLVEGMTLVALGAMLVPIAAAGVRGDVGADRARWVAAPVFMLATIPALSALGLVTVARVWVVVDAAGEQARSAGAMWANGAAEALVADPYLAGLSRLMAPALLGVALPLVYVSMESVSAGVRTLAGLGILIAGLGLGVRVVLGAP